MKKLILLLSILLLASAMQAQAYLQTVKGKITDKESGITIPGVVVKMKGDTSGKLSAVSDENGVFKIQKVPVGRRTFVCMLVGYKPYVATDIIVVSGKEVFLNIELEESVQEIGEVEIKADDKGAFNEMSSVSAKTFSIEETERYPGSRQDPARMASNFAGVQGTNDARNDIVVRGNSPSGLLWRLEDVDIPNPNHFSIAGSAGGPQSIINNKYLANSEFFTGAFPANYGNALGGVFDLKMRNGNNEKHERSAQLGVLGTELALEGPINKKTGSSYLVTYRYSTLALFAAGHIPISIGTSAVPQYQDCGFRFNFPTKKAGTFSFSGIGGLSSINIILSTSNKRPKELYGDQNRDQYFNTNMGVAILSHVIALGEKTMLKSSLAISTSSTGSKHYLILRNRDYVANDTLPQLLNFNFTENKTTFTTYIKKKINARHSFKTGFYLNYFQENFYDYVKVASATDTTASAVNNKPWKNRVNTKAGFALVQPYFQYNYKPTDRVTINAGVFSQWLTLNNSYSVEPRAGIKWSITDKQMLSFGYGLHSQIQPTYVYFAYPDSLVKNGVVTANGANGTKVEDNKNLGMSRSQHFVLGYDIFPSKYLRIKAETYYQNLWNVPVDAVPSSVSLLNRGATFTRFFPIYTMQNTGTGQNYGVELTVEKLFHKHYFFLFSGSLFNSTYKGSNGKEWNTDFNGNYIVNFLSGVEYGIGKSKKNSITVGPKITYGGGRRYSAPDRAASDRIMDVVPVSSPVNNLRFPNYFRIDTRIAYKINGVKADYEIALDLVNITNQQNVLALTYAPDPQNPQADPMVRNYQLGFLPLIYFKVNF